MFICTLNDYSQEDRTATLTFENDEGKVYVRDINIPKNEDGTIDEDYFQTIIEGQKQGVLNKFKVGLIQFVDKVKEEEEVTPIDSELEEESESQEEALDIAEDSSYT